MSTSRRTRRSIKLPSSNLFHSETYSKRIEPIHESADQHCCIFRPCYICKKNGGVVTNHVPDKGQVAERVETTVRAWRTKFDNAIFLSRETWLAQPLWARCDPKFPISSITKLAAIAQISYIFVSLIKRAERQSNMLT